MALKVGIQLFSVKDAMAADPVATIEQVAAAGYKYLETANNRIGEEKGLAIGMDTDTLNAVLEKTGSRVVSAHLFPLDEESVKRISEVSLRNGNHTLVYPMELYEDYDDVMRKVEKYERLGKIAAQEGQRFLYHNHFQEFQKFNGKTVMDWIAEGTDPAHVNFELDTFWAMRGGCDPVEVMDHLGSRIKMLHQKDFSKESGSPVNLLGEIPEGAKIDGATMGRLSCKDDFVEIGYGRMDIQSILNKALELGSVEYVILEQDATKLDELESIRRSMESFRKFEGIDRE